MRNVADHENYVRWVYLTTVLYMGECQKYARTQFLDQPEISFGAQKSKLCQVGVSLKIAQNHSSSP